MKMVNNKKGENQRFSPCNFSPKNRKDLRSAIFLPENRRGSHIDVILSFIIFISFVVFLYAMIQPNITSKIGKTAFLNYMEGELIKNLTGTDLTAISIRANPQSSQNCLQLVNFMSSAGISSMSLSLKNLAGTTFPAYKSGGDLYIDLSPDENSELFKVYYSPSFNLIADNSLGSCQALQKDASSNGYFIDRKESYTSYYIWNNNINQLISSYNNDYNSVKDGFNLSPAENFGFSFEYQNQVIVKTNKIIPASINVYSATFPVAYVSANNNLEAGNLIVTAW